MVLGIDSQSNHWLLGKLEITDQHVVACEVFHTFAVLFYEFREMLDALVAIRRSIVFIVAQKKIGTIEITLYR